jgi:pyruvate,water dikinase
VAVAEPDLVRWLTDPGAVQLSCSGGKGANLARLNQASLPVPPGFIVATAAYRRFVEVAGLAPLIARVTAELDGADTVALEAASATLRAAFEASPVPPDLAAAIRTAYLALGGGSVAVRSSATAEDLPEASFAGQQDTLLDVVGGSEVVTSVRRCWSSLWTARALAYRARNGMTQANVMAAVVVQRMVPADVAGVLFTADPLTGRRDHVVVEAVRGRGDRLVGGQVTPQRWILDGRSRAVRSGPDRSDGPVLDTGQLAEIVELGMRAAAVLGAPQDLEWATASGRCWVLQARPITSLFPLPSVAPPPGAPPRVYLPAYLVAQGMVEPLTPAGNAFFLAMAPRASGYWSLRGREQADLGWMSVILGRVYYDVTDLLASPRLADRLCLRLRWKDPATSAALREWLDANAARLPRPRGPALPVGLSVWVLRQLSGVLGAAAAPGRARRRLLVRADAELAELQREAARLSCPRDRVEFVTRVLPARTLGLVMAQLPPVYLGLLAGPLAEWLAARWLGGAAGLEPVRRWLPHDPTVAMGVSLARLAGSHAAAGLEPSPISPGVREFLATYGHRAPDREIDLGLPRFADDPTYVVDLLRSYLTAGGQRDLLARHQAGVREAEAAAGELVAAVRRTRGPARALLMRAVLHRYRNLAGLRERPKFDLVRAIALGRGVLGEVGAAVVKRGMLDEADDVFFVDWADLRAAMDGEVRDVRAQSARARREYRRELTRRAIPRILTSEGEALYGPTARPVAVVGTLVGTGVSPGVHEGVVRVLDSPVGAQLRPGEVLVAATTDPGWTPLFLLAGALVMEVGGAVSHGAIVAREYGIPAVATVTDATVRLRTGQRVRVDGGAGVITMLDADAGPENGSRRLAGEPAGPARSPAPGQPGRA